MARRRNRSPSNLTTTNLPDNADIGATLDMRRPIKKGVHTLRHSFASRRFS
jgi:hypothetical protein